jgi:hypothetical protein
LDHRKDHKERWLLLPVFGIILYVILYIIATRYYPGGSQADKNSIGYSWINNYWCNLLYANGINGKPNAAQPIAMTAMGILCISLSLFWIQFPRFTTLNKPAKRAIQVSGTLAMIIGFLLFTNFNHDLIINTASCLGLIAMAGTFVGLYQNGWKVLFGLGLVNIVMIILNNVFYHTEGLIVYLPVIQKITFLVFLFWICCISFKIIFLKKPEGETAQEN